MKRKLRLVTAVLLVLALTLCYVPAAFAGDNEPVFGTDGNFEYKVVTPEEGDPYSELVKYTGSLEEVTVPDSFGGAPLKVIGYEAFYGISGMKTVNLPDGITLVDDRAFCNCYSLDNVMLPDSVEEIGDYAFSGCYHRESATDIVTGITSILNETGLTFIHIPSSLKVIGDSAFAGCEIFLGNTYIPSKITDSPDAPALVLPSTMTEIGAEAFSQCRSLINVVISEGTAEGKGVKEIKTGTFTNCLSLEMVEIPSSVMYIYPAFNNAFTDHPKYSEYEPSLYVKAPHCIIEPSSDINENVVIYGAAHSTVQAFVDEINKKLEDEYFFKDWEALVGTVPDIDYRKFVAIDVPGHTFVGTVTVPTCTERGFMTYVCQQCTDMGYYEDPDLSAFYKPHVCEYTLPLGHDYGDWIEDSAAGCTYAGLKHRVCKRELTDTLGNTLYGEGGVALTCGHLSQQPIPATDHNFVLQCTATCTTSGRSWKECTYCHATKEVKSLAPLGHLINYDDPTETIKEVVECDGSGEVGEDGQYVYTCQLCGYVQVATVSAHPDQDGDKLCDKCGKEVLSADISPEQNCKCDCHSQNKIIAWFYKIKIFFWKLFGTNKVCKCGIVHY